MRTEKAVAAVFLLGLFFWLMHWPGAAILLILSSYAMAGIYFPGAFYFFCDKNLKKQSLALSIVSGMFFAIVPMGVVFKIMFWPGFGEAQLLMGVVTAPIILGITIYLSGKADPELATYYKQMRVRGIAISFLALLFYFTPALTLLKIHERNDPEMLRLKTRAYTNPDNEQYYNELMRYMDLKDSIIWEETKRDTSLFPK